MSDFGLSTKIDPDSPVSDLPGSVFISLRDTLNTNPADKDWRALIRAVENKYKLRPVIVEQWSLSTNGQAAGSLLMELSSLGMTIGELVTYLKELKLDTYSLGLAPYEPIVITEEPTEFLEAFEGRSLQIFVEATGNPLPRYQWFFCKDGTDDFVSLRGRVENKLQLDNLTSDNAGAYACQVHNCDDPEQTKISGHCLVSVQPDPSQKFEGLSPVHDLEIFSGPRTPLLELENLGIWNSDYWSAEKIATKVSGEQKLIIGHPQNIAVGMNEQFCLSVETQGNPPLTYQWFKDNLPLQQYSPRLMMAIISPSDYGNYHCIVRNGYITEMSKVARVSEKPLMSPLSKHVPVIEIISQPQSQKVSFGACAMFMCEARCSEPLKYQWFKDGTPLPDKASPEINFRNIQDRTVEGGYQCEISIDLPGREHIRKMTVYAYLNVQIPQVNDNVIYNPSDKVALLIGNSDYRGEHPLNCPRFDVQVLQDLLQQLEFKVVSLLNLTKPEIKSAVLEFCNLVDKNVYCVFYFAGHGFEEDGLSYLVPTDAPAGYKCDECVCADAVLDNIQKKEPPLILMILDICRKPNSNKVSGIPKRPLPSSLEKRANRGNTVFCYATSVGMYAFEPSNRKSNGLLVSHLRKLLTKKTGIDALISELKEEFNSNEKNRNRQIPELRSNLVEPRRSLADKISTKGDTQMFQQRTIQWQRAHELPGQQQILFEDVGVKVILHFQSSFSNILHVFTQVLKKGIAERVTAWTENDNPSISTETPVKLIVKADDPVTTKVTLIDIQKLQSPLCVYVCIECEFKDRILKLKTLRNLGFPLVSTLKLWQPRDNFTPQQREPIEQTEESDSIES